MSSIGTRRQTLSLVGEIQCREGNAYHGPSLWVTRSVYYVSSATVLHKRCLNNATNTFVKNAFRNICMVITWSEANLNFLQLVLFSCQPGDFVLFSIARFENTLWLSELITSKIWALQCSAALLSGSSGELCGKSYYTWLSFPARVWSPSSSTWRRVTLIRGIASNVGSACGSGSWQNSFLENCSCNSGHLSIVAHPSANKVPFLSLTK